MKKYNIYLDDVRTPTEGDWIVVRNYDEFVSKVLELELDNIGLMSLDHDLGETAMKEYFDNVSPNYKLDYNNIEEKTGYDCVKWLVNHFLDGGSDWFLLDRNTKKNYKMPLIKWIIKIFKKQWTNFKPVMMIFQKSWIVCSN